MSDTNHSLQLGENMIELDKRLVEMLESIRNALIHLIRPDQAHPPSAVDRTIGLQILEKATDTTWRLAEMERVRAETNLKLAEADGIRAETERIRAETNLKLAEADRLRAETEKIMAARK